MENLKARNQTRTEEILKDCNALLSGHFLLSSGRHGGQYMQCAKIQQYPELLEEITAMIAEQLKADIHIGGRQKLADIVVAPALGGIAFGYALARQLGTESIFTERVEGKMTLRRGFEIPAGARVIVAEDVITTGLSTREVIEVVESCKGIPVGAAAMVDRSGGTVQIGTPLVTAYSKQIPSYLPEECPLCADGDGPKLVKPGSRG